METNGEGTATPQEEMASGKEELTAKIKVHVLTVDRSVPATKQVELFQLGFVGRKENEICVLPEMVEQQ